MMNNTTKPDSLQPAAEKAVDLFDNWFDPIETEVRVRAREFIEELLRGLGYELFRLDRQRQLVPTHATAFADYTIAVPRPA